ncbi:MAG: exopolysaccharide biosynthesis polyprenyl glycosylphosphotransferase [bacterium]
MGIDIDSLTADEFLDRIDEFIYSRIPHQVSYLNADCLNKCWSDRQYRETIAASDLVYADGMSVVWASRLFGHPLPERLNANDLLPEFCRRAQEQRYRIFLLGGEDGVSEKTAEYLKSCYPELQIVGVHNGYFSPDEEAAVIQKIRDANPDILIVGMGAPRQELWIHRNLKKLGVPVAWGVGGLLDYSAKGIKRAPVWMRKYGLEWFWRLWLEPRRLWKRYLLGNILFTFRVGFLVFADIIMASLAWMLAYVIRVECIPKLTFLPQWLRKEINPLENYFYALPLIILTWVVICASLDLYRRQNMRTPLDEMAAIVKMVFLFLISSMAVAFLFKDLNPARAVIIISAGLAFLFMVVSRFAWAKMEKSLFQEGIGRIRTLIVGSGVYAKELIESLQSYGNEKYEILGIIDNHHPAGEQVYGHPILGPLPELPDWAGTLAADQIFFADRKLNKRDILNTVAACGEKTNVRQFNIMTDMFGVITDHASFANEEDIPYKVLRQGVVTPFERFCKRIMDLMIASTLLLMACPFLPLISLLIRLSSKGPAIFKHTRIGKDGKPFIMYKFRTMYRDVNEYQEAPIRKDDPRVLPYIGQWLRRSSLDELPQLWNVIKGEMSMVGPRPEMPFIVNTYEPWQRRRLKVLPGITGLWQISGRKDIPLKSHLEYDFYYIQNQSLLFDIIILLKTIPVVLFGKGAY